MGGEGVSKNGMLIHCGNYCDKWEKAIFLELAGLNVDWDAVRGMLESGKWVAVAGDPPCVKGFIDRVSRLCGSYTFIAQSPHVLLGLVRKCREARAALGVSNKAWSSTYFIITFKLPQGVFKCYAKLWYDLDEVLRLIGMMSLVRRNITIIKPEIVDDVISRIREKVGSGEWLLVDGVPSCVFELVIASVMHCNEAPIVYLKQPSTVVALVRKCPALFEELSRREAADRLTEEGFRRLKAVEYAEEYVDEEGRGRCEGVIHITDEEIEVLLENMRSALKRD